MLFHVQFKLFGSCSKMVTLKLIYIHAAKKHLNQFYTVSQKSIPDIFDCNLKTCCQISIIFDGIFLTQLAIKWSFSFPLHPTFVNALPGENTISEISLFIQCDMIA